ncbi:hypothetical protein S7711_04314 [Stachybotrys chartarum IBT 7711]|uniref:J domain-containing protein n=1 Tax=Stachybotrys chartarum (strain CBS 109288 / IBT 7711) TaxID=1280523 RepID=A0A084AJD7_STACB|nr:hypothetical protein S7711_04314 [Stachybotrys chartarum IBT 7711]
MILKRAARAVCPSCRSALSPAASSSADAAVRTSLRLTRTLPAVSSSSSPLPSSSSSFSSSPCTFSDRRRFATARDKVPHWPPSPEPTPYEILDIKRGEPYSKRRFHELVKLYHPDKHDHSTALAHIPYATRVDRYRLIVAAHDLLSDPVKRSLYDTHGVGWTAGRPPSIHDSLRYNDHAWRDRANNPAGNATWEDWERWYERRDGRAPQQPAYMSNGMFATLVVALCMVGAFVQMYRAETNGEKYVEYKARHHGQIAEELRRSNMMTAGMNRDERVENFLKDRENTVYDYTPNRYDDSPRNRN